MRFKHMTDQQILAELATRFDHLQRSKGYSDKQVTERGGVSPRTISAFTSSHKDITLSSFIKLLRGADELARLADLLPPAEPTYSPAKGGFVQPPQRVRAKKRSDRSARGFKWGDES